MNTNTSKALRNFSNTTARHPRIVRNGLMLTAVQMETLNQIRVGANSGTAARCKHTREALVRRGLIVNGFLGWRLTTKARVNVFGDEV